MRETSVGLNALMLITALLLQSILVAPMALAAPSDDETRLPAGYVTVFQDDFDAGVIDRSKWVHWEGEWSTDNVATNSGGGIYTGDEIYLTESPFQNGFGDPLDDNGNQGKYYPDQAAMIETVWIDLREHTAPKLEFEHMYDIPSPGDGAMVFVMTDTGQEWEVVLPETQQYTETTGWSGTLQTWMQVSFRLDEYSGHRVRIGFFLRSSDDGTEGDGWKIDDVEVGGRMPSVQLPDLKLASARVLLGGYPVDTAIAGDVLEFNISIINEGSAYVDAYVVSAYTDHPLAGGMEIGSVIPHDGLGVGSTTWVTMRWVAMAGRFDFLVIVDEMNQVPEKDEDNNRKIIKEFHIDESSSGDAALIEMHFEANGEPILGAGVGDLITIVARLVNLGTSSVSGPMVVKAYDGVYEPSSEPIGDSQPTLDAMEPGSEHRIAITWRPLEGVHNIAMVVTAQKPGEVLDLNAENDISWSKLNVTDDPGHDLVVEDLQFIIDSQVVTGASEDDSVHVLTIVGNHGFENYTGILEVGIYRGDPDAGGEEMDRKVIIAELEPEGTWEVEFDWRAELGTHAIYIFVDPDNYVYESVEDNNQLGRGLTVTRIPLPDLAVSSMRLMLNGVELDPAIGTNDGAEVEINVTVINLGNDKTKGTLAVEAYLGNPLLMEETQLGTFDVPEGLNPDEVYMGSVYWKAVKPQHKYDVPVIFVKVDASLTEAEVNEFNNIDLLPLPVGAALPDLTIRSLEITDVDGIPIDAITYGGTIKLTVTVTNVGTDISFQVALVGLFLDSAEPANRIGTITTSTLSINQVERNSITWSPGPDVVSGGTHAIIAIIDPSNEIEESSDANNDIAGHITIDADALPNLLLMDVWLTKGERTVDSVEQGDRATVHLRVLNIGEAPLFTSASVELFHGDPIQGGSPVSSWQIAELGVRESITYEVEWTFNEDLPLVVFIDRINVVHETNENDNHGSTYFEVTSTSEDPDYLVIGAMIALGVVILLVMTVLIRRRPAVPEDEEEDEGTAEDEDLVEATDEEEETKEAEREGPEAEGPEAEEPETEGPEVEEPEPGEPAVEEPEPVDGKPSTGIEETEGPAEEAPAATTCPHCGEEVDAEWILCPFCEKDLR